MVTNLFPEILAYIMILTQESPLPSVVDTTPEDDDVDSNSNHGKPSPPFEITISHVNSQLREIALCTPHLWFSIHVNTGVQNAHLTLERTKAYLNRSGDHFLDLRIEVNEANCDYKERWMLREALELVAKESRRWRKLTIISEREGIAGMDTLISKLSQYEGEESLSNLEHLSISADYASDGEGEIEEARYHTLLNSHSNENHPRSSPGFRKTLLKCLPKLSFLRLRGLALYTFQPVFLPTLRILHLDQTKAIPMTSDLFEGVAAACPALEHLSVYGDIIKSPKNEAGAVRNLGLEMPIPRRMDNFALRDVMDGNIGSSRGRTADLSAKFSPQGSISLPQLRSLRVCGTQGFVYKVLLSRLEAPKLRNLMFKDAHEHDLDTLWQPSLAYPQVPTIARSSEAYASTSKLKFIQIQSLTISNSNLSKSIYQGLFRVFPSITEFSSYSSMDPATASKLFDDRVKDVPWPNLRMLTFIFDMDLTADDKTIVEMLRKRKGVGFPVQKVRIGVAELGSDHVQVQKPVGQETAIVVEKLENFDVWPSDRPYPDVDDILF